jgi:hypothetical protein
MNTTEPQYAGHTILRPAHGGDKGWNSDPEAGEQVVIKGGGGEERVVLLSDLGEVVLRGHPNINDPQSTNNMAAGTGAPGLSPREPGDDEDAISRSSPRGGTTIGSISGDFKEKTPKAAKVPRLRMSRRDRAAAEARDNA